ncbi:MAG: FAD-dependent oxidoreductase [Solirubrobacteraceae bacterium]|nr:FAD-dependent oxidoreductase [Solirubrobacteraceae bacterium]
MSGPGLWHATAPPRERPAPSLARDVDADVVIVGGGFSGLWTAYHLLAGDPTLRVAVLEREVIGFGASGRNGGWLMAAAPADLRVWERRFGLASVQRAQRVLIEAVREVAALDAALGLGSDVRLGGAITMARSAAEQARLVDRRAAMTRWGWPAEDLTWLDPTEVQARLGAQATRGALQALPCGTLHPVRLVHGLAAAVQRMGGMLFEHTPASAISSGRVECGDLGTVRAPHVVLATEAFTIEQPGQGRRYLPLASTMIATEPLTGPAAEELSWRDGQAVGDARHLFFYAQHTPDGRIAIGGRGAPYRLGSGLSVAGDADPATTARLEQTLREVWPQTEGVAIEHRWSGSLAVPRDWCASCGVDRATGIGWLGGYAGHGVAATFVLARSLAAQLRGVPDPAGPQPWTLHRARGWEPEPLRWLASQAIVRVLGSADEVEQAGGTARRAHLVHRFTGS